MRSSGCDPGGDGAVPSASTKSVDSVMETRQIVDLKFRVQIPVYGPNSIEVLGLS